jgi:hypothetical protein
MDDARGITPPVTCARSFGAPRYRHLLNGQREAAAMTTLGPRALCALTAIALPPRARRPVGPPASGGAALLRPSRSARLMREPADESW